MLARHLVVLIALATTLGWSVPVAAHAPGLIVSGFGTATADGMLAPGEWQNAGRVPFQLTLPGGGSTPATLFVMNDATNLYMAVQFAQPAGVQREDTLLFFDLFRNHSGVQISGDDSLFLSPGVLGFADSFRTTQQCTGGLCTQLDRQAGGRTDGAGAFSDAGGTFTFELFHPLDSGDLGHDLVLRPGETAGFVLTLLVKGALTILPSSSLTVGFGDLVIARPTNVLIAPSRSEVSVGDTLSVSLQAQNEAGNPELDLYAGVLLEDGQTLLFFTQPGVIGAQALLSNPAAFAPLLSLTPGSGAPPFPVLTIAVPPSVRPGTYWLFAALVRRGSLTDNRINDEDVIARDVRSVTVLP